MTQIYNYDRRYTLSVGRPPVDYKRTGVVEVTGSINGTKAVRPSFTENEYSVLAPDYVLDYRTEYNALEISDLHVEIEVSKNGKSSSGQTSPCTIKIYNLSEDTQNFFCKVGNNVILKGGYSYSKEDNELPILYTGQVESFNTEKVGEDKVTTLYCKDGYTPSSSVKVGIYWKDPDYTLTPLTYGDLLRHIAKIWAKNGIKNTKNTVITDLPINYVYESSADQIPLDGGYTFQGTLKQLTDTVCADLGYRWYIDNSILYLEPKYSKETKTRYTFLLATEQILSIQDQQNNTRNSDNGVGVKIRSLLDGRFEVGKFVEVTGGEKQGLYKITQVEHTLQYRGGNWNTVATCEEIKDD